MNKFMHTASYVILLVLALSVICLLSLVSAKEYREYRMKRELKCEILFYESMAIRKCEYVDGVVKIKI